MLIVSLRNKIVIGNESQKLTRQEILCLDVERPGGHKKACFMSVKMYCSFALLIITNRKRYLDIIYYIFDYFLIFIN